MLQRLRRGLMRRKRAGLGICGVLVLLAACARDDAPQLRVDAAASLREVVLELGALHAQRTGGPAPRFNLAGSGELARQIEAARKTDVFLSAGALELDRLTERGLIAPDSRRVLCSNRLVVVARQAHADFRAEQLEDSAHVSVAHTELVPAGRYAAEWLRAEGLFDELEGRLTRAANVRAALAAVQSGACDFGIVYASDVAVAPDLHVVYRVPAQAAPPIEYGGAVLVDAALPDEARAFLELCVGAEGRAVFERHGFETASD
jgi:molybdate transport system substrate-binding protein